MQFAAGDEISLQIVGFPPRSQFSAFLFRPGSEIAIDLGWAQSTAVDGSSRLTFLVPARAVGKGCFGLKVFEMTTNRLDQLLSERVFSAWLEKRE